MAFALVQHKAAKAFGTTPLVTLDAAPTAGNLVVAVITLKTASPPGNPSGYSLVLSWDSASGWIRGVARQATAGQSATITFSSSPGFWEIEAYEFSGSWSSGAVSTAVNSQDASTVTSLTTGSITPANGSALLIGACLVDVTNNGGSEAVDSGYTILDTGTFQFSEHAYKIKTDALAENPSFSWATAAHVGAAQMAFYLAQTVPVGQATETDTALPLGTKTKTLSANGVPAEIDTALPLGTVSKISLTAPTGTISSGGPTFNVTYTYSGPVETMHRTVIQNAAATVTYYDSGYVAPGAIAIDAVAAGIPTDTTGSALLATIYVQSASQTVSASHAFDIQWGVVTGTALTSPGSLVTTSTITPAWTFSSTRGFTQAQYRVRLLSSNSATVFYDSGFVSSAATSAAISYVLSDASHYRVELTVKNTMGVSN